MFKHCETNVIPFGKYYIRYQEPQDDRATIRKS